MTVHCHIDYLKRMNEESAVEMALKGKLAKICAMINVGPE